MPDLINIDVKEANDKLILINKYFMLIIVICFGSAIIFLYMQVKSLNDRMYQYMNQDLIESVKTIQHTQGVIQENTNTLDRLNNYIIQHQNK
jgi:hypothetical protein